MINKIVFIRENERVILPTRAYEGDAGWDLYITDEVEIPPRSFKDVNTGLRLALPFGFWGRLVGRSSTLRRMNCLVADSVIDPGYRGSMFFGLFNLGENTVMVKPGDRLAQLILHRVVDSEWVELEEGVQLPTSDRGEAGFGSSGR